MKPPEENTQSLGEFENSKSYVKIKLGMSGNLEITIKAGDDATPDLLKFQKKIALENLEEILKDEKIKERIGVPKKPKLDSPF